MNSVTIWGFPLVAALSRSVMRERCQWRHNSKLPVPSCLGTGNHDCSGHAPGCCGGEGVVVSERMTLQCLVNPPRLPPSAQRQILSSPTLTEPMLDVEC